MSDEVINRKIAVILVADVVGYSKHMEKDEDATLEAYAECEKILKSLLNKRQGSIFNTAGDSVLAEFSSAVNAVECAVEFQNKIKERNQSEQTWTKLEYRIGINIGDVVSREGNLLGDGVNIAARLEALCQPNSVCISKSIYDLVISKTKVTFNDLGVQKVKQNQFHAYDILLDPSQKRKIESDQSNTSKKLVLAGVTVLVLLIGAVLYSFSLTGDQSRPVGNQRDYTQTDIRRVLIRPAQFLSSNDSLSYLAPGFTTYLNTTLSQHPSLNIVPETTASYVDRNGLTNTDVRAEYGIDYIIDNTIQISGKKIRVSTKISNLITEQVVASEVYEFAEEEVFQYQDKISELALQKMSMMDHSGASNQRISTNPIIYKKHILAQANMLSWTPEGHFKAVGLIEESLKLEP